MLRAPLQSCGAALENDTSVITSAVLAGQLHPDMLYLVDFSAAALGTLHRGVGQDLVVLR